MCIRDRSMALSVGFYGLGLHKIFARCMPENTPSRNLLHATGFFEEGIERDSILIQGKWEDHKMCIRDSLPVHQIQESHLFSIQSLHAGMIFHG